MRAVKIYREKVTAGSTKTMQDLVAPVPAPKKKTL
jgi:hypothetical protein